MLSKGTRPRRQILCETISKPAVQQRCSNAEQPLQNQSPSSHIGGLEACLMDQKASRGSGREHPRTRKRRAEDASVRVEGRIVGGDASRGD